MHAYTEVMVVVCNVMSVSKKDKDKRKCVQDSNTNTKCNNNKGNQEGTACTKKFTHLQMPEICKIVS